MAEERLQKILAACGLGSRRACEGLIFAGRVSVNGEVVVAPGTKAAAGVDRITVDGKEVRPQQHVYIMLNKPADCLCAARDHRGRKTVMDYVCDAPVRVFHVGRLDYDTEGLLLFTNDGAFSQRVTHPRHKVFKTYRAVVRGVPDEETLDRLRAGIELDDGPTAPAVLRLIGTTTAKVRRVKKKNRPPEEIDASDIEIKIREGRKRQVKRMLRAVGHPVISLRRTAIGSLELGSLPCGQWMQLTKSEAESALKNE